MKTSIRRASLKTAALLPIALIGGWFTGLYTLYDLYPAELRQQVITQLGSIQVACLLVAIQYMIYTAICGCFGFLLSEKVGLARPLRPKMELLRRSLLPCLACGLLFALDYPVFGRLIPGVAASYERGLSAANVIASVLLGGVIEEVMLRLFLMSLLSLLFWKLFSRKCDRMHIPTPVYVAANAVSALAFAAGHLPATISTFGALTPMLILRCFLLNGAFGLVFGALYRRYGIQYAMLGHISTHVISKLCWLLFI